MIECFTFDLTVIIFLDATFLLVAAHVRLKVLA